MSDAYENLSALLDSRFSCRAYLDEPVPREMIVAIAEAAQKVPSWCNAQPWQLIVTEATETDRFRDALYAHARENPPQPDMEWPTNYPGVYGTRRRTCGWQLYDAVGVARGDRAASARQMMENYRFFGAPHVAILHAPKELGAYGAMDCGGYVTAFCLAAQAQGLATVPQAAIAAFAPFVRDWFGFGPDRLVLCAISFGFADLVHPANGFRTERAPVHDVIEWRR